MNTLLSPLLALLLISPAVLASDYATSFEGPEFGVGEIHRQKGWSAAYGSAPELCTIVDESGAPVAPPDGMQMLRLVRPTAEGRPVAGIIFHEEPTPLMEFTAEFQLAYQSSTTFPLYQVEIGSAADSKSGVHVGIGFFDTDGGARVMQVYQGAGTKRRPVAASGDADSRPTEPMVFYHFTLRVYEGGGRYDLTVRQGDEVIASTTAQEVDVLPNTYNRLIVSIPGGSQEDQLFFDALTITP